MVPIRVLCVFSELNRGGAETMCMNLYRHIDRTKVQFDFVKHTPTTGAYEEEILALGGRIYEAPRYMIFNHCKYCQWWKKHFREHPEHRIVHGHFITIAAVYFQIAKKAECISVAHSHSTKPRGSIFQVTIKKFYARKAQGKADYCFACSQDAGKWLFPNKEFTVLNNAIDAQKFQCDSAVREKVRTELGLDDSFTVGIVGSLSEVKNPFGTIEIFKAVHNKMPSAKLLWVGGGALEQAIQQKLKEENLTDAVIMTGVRPDVDRLMQAMDVFIFPSLNEGLEMVAIEAQAAGVPCLCSDRVPREAGITELCQFLPLGQPDLWADRILSSDLTRRDTYHEICNAGYDVHSAAKYMEKFYLKISGI